MAYEAIITTLGLAKIADAIANDTPLNISRMAVGDGNGNPTEPADTDTALVREVFDDAPNRVGIDPQDETRIICELVVPASEGGWTIREIGLFDDDDDLIAIARFPEFYKALPEEGATLDLVCRLYIVVSNTEAITLVVDTSVVIATRQWVNDQIALLIPGGTTDQILTKVSNADGDYEWRDATDINVTLDIVEEEQTLATSQVIVDLATCTTDGLAVYVEGIRLHPPEWAATTSTRITLATSYTAGSKIYCVQNEPTGASAFLAQAQNLADVPDKEEARTNLELLTDTTYLDDLWQLMNQRQYPVGEIYMTRQAGNPSSLLGFGTWERYGQGRAIVGYDEGDSSFNSQDKTGGTKTHVLTESELPAHRHRLGVEAGGELVSVVGLGGGVGDPSGDDVVAGSLVGYTRSIALTATGGGQAHNNLQPYITIFMWKRTA